MVPAVMGFGTSLSLLAAIGAQNAFVLRQGLRREHLWAVVLTCALSDLLLIAAGVAGLGALLTGMPAVLTAARWGGAAFLFGYAVLAARRALRPGALTAAAR
ncbi:LysE/ArgO family amino acid transporter, partial [Luedemannella flava]|uniref:LysE/ArgO family amino acid transporter n=1 Tax=Luedemannella flava TaxID=349316 RepID=UPI0031D3DA9C